MWMGPKYHHMVLYKIEEEGYLQIAEERREAKGKAEKERYPFECRVPKNSKER